MGQFEQTQNTHQNKMPETRVPMTLRDQFLQDPFFKSAWEDMESFRGSFLRDSQSKKMIESSEKREERKEENKEENSSLNRRFGRYLVPRKWMMPSLLNGEESLKLNDSGVINTVNDDTKLELSLNTAGYKPSELSQDGVLVITVPKEKRIQELKEENKMKMERRKSVEKKEESKSVQQINVENRSGASTLTAENKNKTTSLVPMNLRESFFDDPFFKDNWLDIQQSQR